MFIKIDNSEGDSFILPQINKYILNSWDGFAYIPQSIVTEKAPEQIGTTVVNRIFESRALNVDFTITASNRQAVFNIRREVINIINSVYKEGVLTWIQNDGSEYHIDVELENIQMPGIDAQGKTFQQVQLSFLAEDPRWYKETKTEILESDLELDVLNNGDTKTSAIFEINGPAKNPKIINLSTNKKIEVNITLAENESLEINTEFGNKNILYKKETGGKVKVFGLLELSSELFYLEKGRNKLEFKAYDTNDKSNCVVSFNERYLGV
jgi:hypothetical protein